MASKDIEKILGDYFGPFNNNGTQINAQNATKAIERIVLEARIDELSRVKSIVESEHLELADVHQKRLDELNKQIGELE